MQYKRRTSMQLLLTMVLLLILWCWRKCVCKCFRWNVFLPEDCKPQLWKLLANKQWNLDAWLCLAVSYSKWTRYLQHDAKMYYGYGYFYCKHLCLDVLVIMTVLNSVCSELFLRKPAVILLVWMKHWLKKPDFKLRDSVIMHLLMFVLF
jgi:hypothetical protein